MLGDLQRLRLTIHQALNSFLEESDDLRYDSCCFRIVDDLDLDTIVKGHDPKNLVSNDFRSPFLGWTIKQVKRWFIANVRKKPRRSFVNRNFVIIDEGVQPVNDEADSEAGTVILCDAQTRMFKTVRIEIPIVLLTAIDLHMKVTMREGSLGIYWRTGTICREKEIILLDKGCWYSHKGAPEIDEELQVISEEWSEGGPRDFESCTDSDEEAESVIEEPSGGSVEIQGQT